MIVEPVVLMTVCDAFIRRNEGQERVIGAVLGKLKDGVMTISTCFAVPHMEQGEVCGEARFSTARLVKYSVYDHALGLLPQVKLDIEHLDTLLKNYKKVFPKESLVGWYVVRWLMMRTHK